MTSRRPPRQLSAALLAALMLVGLPGAALADPDVTPPSGTLTIGNGSGYANTLTVPLHVPATDDVGVVSVKIELLGTVVAEMPYAETIDYTFPADGHYGVTVEWWDAAGNGSTSAQVWISIDRVPPDAGFLQFYPDASATDAIMTATIGNAGAPLSHVRFRTGSGPWGVPIEVGDPYANPLTVDWPMLDPAAGGSPKLGPRTVSYQVLNLAGTWSATGSEATGVAFEGGDLAVSGDIRTGHDVTFTPVLPADVTYPAATTCWWDLAWGDDQSLYYGERNSTFGGISISGPPSEGYCDPWTVTLPWVPYRRFMVTFRADLDGNPMVDVSLGSSPEATDAVRPEVDSTSRKILRSSLPLVYVLPDDYLLTVGVPATYRAYAIAGASITAQDVWTVAYVDTPERKYGGSVFTFTPRQTGHITVCWGSDERRTYQISACYDPPARRRDRTDPTTSVPKVRFGTGGGGDIMPVDISWTGKDVGWGVKSYRLERSLNGGAWKKVSLPAPKTKVTTQMLTSGTTYRYRLRATDNAGNVGSWRYTSAFKPRRTGDTNTSPALVYSGTWSAVSDATALGGVVHESSTAGASVKFKFRGRAVAWLAEIGPANGSAKVYVDGKYIRTVGLANANESARRIVFRSGWGTVGTHTIRIIVSGTPGHPIVSLDGFAVLR